MGKQDVISKVYLGAADRIADLLNNEFFEGDSVVAASDITEMDSTAAKIIKAEDNVVNVRVVAKDLARKVWFGVQVMPSGYEPAVLLISPAGGFLVLGCLIALVQFITSAVRKKEEK